MSDSYSVGFATMLAVLLHEVPTELGEFCILVQAGLSKKVAIAASVAVSGWCWIGAVIGLSIGLEVEEGSKYIMALTCGSFLYIAFGTLSKELIDKMKGLDRMTRFYDSLMQIGAMFLGL